jgi:predicted nuclease with TOPRIM domain
MPDESKLAEKYEEATKFNEEEIKKLQELQESYIDVQNKLGQISIARIKTDQQIESFDRVESELRNKFTEIQTEEQEFMKSVTDKYGDGSLDPITGVFTSNKS